MVLILEAELTDLQRDLRRTVHRIGSKEIIPKILRIGHDGPAEYYLLYYDGDRTFLTDTFHGSLAEALEQADFEYGVQQDQWAPIHEEIPKTPPSDMDLRIRARLSAGAEKTTDKPKQD